MGSISLHFQHRSDLTIYLAHDSEDVRFGLGSSGQFY